MSSKSSWSQIFSRSPAKSSVTNSVAQKSSKEKAWESIVIDANSTKKNDKSQKAKKVIKFMTYNTKQSVVLCRCGETLWSGKRHKRCDLVEHYIGSNKHKKWQDKMEYGQDINKSKNNPWYNKWKNSFKDTIGDILNFPYLYATFVITYFIIDYNLSLNDNNNMDQGSDSESEDDIPISQLRKDYIPVSFGDLMPSQGVVTQNDLIDSLSTFICDHEWDTVSTHVLQCVCCENLCCTSCMDSKFMIRKREINKMIKKKNSYKCSKCKLIELADNKKKNKSKRKKRRIC